MAVMKHTGDRRAFLAAGMGTIVGVGVAPAAFATGTCGPTDLMDAIRAHDAWTRQMDAGQHSDAEWSQWEQAGNNLYSKIEALPNTPENAKVKARAVWSIVNGEEDDINDGVSTSARLVRQVIASLMGDA